MHTHCLAAQVRVPFLDRDFLDVAMSINAEDKMIRKAEGRMEKYILRKAFDDPADPYLPPKILWRQKEQFSDGVGYGCVHVDKRPASCLSAISDVLLVCWPKG